MRLFLLLAVCFFSCSVFSQGYYLKFPDDVSTEYCDGSNDFGALQLYNPDSLPLVTEYHDMPVDGVPEVCYWFERYWFIYNQASYDPSLGCVTVPNPNPFALPNQPMNLLGPLVSPIDTSGHPWSASVIKISPPDPAPTNFSVYWSADANCYQYKQWIKIRDYDDPVLESCLADPVTLPDTTQNDPELWNAPYWWDPPAGSQDMREAQVDFSVRAFDSCARDGIYVRYVMRLDLDQDGKKETGANTLGLQTPGMVNYNGLDPTGSNSELRRFDNRPGVDSLQRYRFAIEPDWSQNPPEFRMRWAEHLPDTVIYSLPQLPPGQHYIRWEVYDNCGNYATCEYDFEILGGVVSVRPVSVLNLQFSATPNPFLEQTFLRFNLQSSTPVLLQICDTNGRQVFGTERKLPAGEQAIPIAKTDLGNTPGIYWYSLQAGQERVSGKLVMLPSGN